MWNEVKKNHFFLKFFISNNLENKMSWIYAWSNESCSDIDSLKCDFCTIFQSSKWFCTNNLMLTILRKAKLGPSRAKKCEKGCKDLLAHPKILGRPTKAWAQSNHQRPGWASMGVTNRHTPRPNHLYMRNVPMGSLSMGCIDGPSDFTWNILYNYNFEMRIYNSDYLFIYRPFKKLIHI